MTAEIVLWAAALLGLALIALRRPLALLGRVLVRGWAGLCLLWLANQAGGLLGVKLGVNLANGLMLGLLGAPGLGLLLLTRWALH